MSEPIIGIITYLDTHEKVSYTDAAALQKQVEHENWYGSPMSIQLDKSAFNNRMPAFILECDPPVHAQFM